MNKSNKFKNGDKFKILDAGDKSKWSQDMNLTIGKTGTVYYTSSGNDYVAVDVDGKYGIYHASNLEFVSSKEDNNLTQSELQALVSVISFNISKIEECISDIKIDIKYCYSKCNPDDPLTASFFEVLNDNKDYLRYLNSKKNKLAKIQAKLKRNLSNLSTISKG